MAYTIRKSDNSSFTITNGSADTTHTSLVLVGKNYAGYGEFLQTNLVKLLENFAYTDSPANPTRGQLWWDTAHNLLKVYTGTSWKISTGATSAPTSSPPGDLSLVGGDLWFDNVSNQLKMYTGSQWIVVGPPQSSSVGDTGAFPVTMADTNGGGHVVVQIKFSGAVYAIFSKDTFTSSLSGFTTVKAGLNFSTAVSPTQVLNTQDITATGNTLVQRDISGGINAIGVNATSVQASSVAATTITGNIVVPSGGSFTSSGYSTYNGAEILTAGGVANFSSINNTIIGNATPSTATFLSVLVSGSSGLNVAFGGINPSSNLVANIGSTSGYFNQTYSNAVTVLNGLNAAANVGASIGSSGTYFNQVYGNAVTVLTRVTPTANLGASLGSTGAYFNQVYSNAVTVLSGGIAPTANLGASIGSTGTYFNQIYGNAVTVLSGGISPASNLAPSLGSTGKYFNQLFVNEAVVLGAITPSAGNVAVLGSNSNWFNTAYVNTSYLNTASINNITVNTGLVPSANLTVDIGSSSRWFNNIYGTAVHAQYADLAERFEADAEYDAGTVVELGGDKEITAAGEDLSENVFGVISTKAAYLMNSGAGSNQTHPPIAVQGRVPVKVTGRVRKGDRLVSAGNGIARAGARSEITAWNVIGRALENKTDDGLGTIEAVVKLNS